MHPQLPGTAESHLFGRPRALPLYPIARTFSSTWSVTTVPTCRRAQVERLASSSAMRMYTSYRGMRSTAGGDAPSGSTFKKWVLDATPSLKTLMHLLVRVVIAVVSSRARLREPGVEPRGHETVGALLARGRADGEVVGILVLGVPGVPLDPAPGDLVRRGGLHELLPELDILERAALALPAARLPPRHPFAHPLHEVLRVGDVDDAGVAPLAANPFQSSDCPGQSHLVVGRLRGRLVEAPPRQTVSGGRLDQRGVPAGTRLGAVVPQAALVGMDQDAGPSPGRAGHVRVG